MGVGKMRKACALTAGICFAAGWWMFIDSNVYVNKLQADGVDQVPMLFYYYIPGIVATLGLVMTNLADTDYLNPYSWVYDESVGTRVRLWLLASFGVSIGAVAAAIWMMAAIWIPKAQDDDTVSDWPGVAMSMQTALIMFASLLLLACKGFQDSEYEQM